MNIEPSQIEYLYRKCYIIVDIVKYTLSFFRNDEKYTRKSYELLIDDYLTAFSHELIIVSQNVKFASNMGLNVPTRFIYYFQFPFEAVQNMVLLILILVTALIKGKRELN